MDVNTEQFTRTIARPGRYGITRKQVLGIRKIMWRLDLPITERQVTFLWSKTASHFLTVKTGWKKGPRCWPPAKPENSGPVKITHKNLSATEPDLISPGKAETN